MSGDVAGNNVFEPISGNQIFTGIESVAQQVDSLSVGRLQLVGTETGTEFLEIGCFSDLFNDNQIYPYPFQWSCTPPTGGSTSQECPNSAITFPFDVVLTQINIKYNASNPIQFFDPTTQLLIDIVKYEPNNPPITANSQTLTPDPFAPPPVAGQPGLGLLTLGPYPQAALANPVNLEYPNIGALRFGITGDQPAAGLAVSPETSWNVIIPAGTAFGLLLYQTGGAPAPSPPDGNFQVVLNFKRQSTANVQTYAPNRPLYPLPPTPSGGFYVQ